MMLFSKIKNSVNDRKRSKGSTLAELVIVLAVASIISTAVVSYAVMFNKRVKNHNEKLNLMQDMSIAQVFVENWIEDLIVENPTLENVKFEINDGVLSVEYSEIKKTVASKRDYVTGLRQLFL